MSSSQRVAATLVAAKNQPFTEESSSRTTRPTDLCLERLRKTMPCNEDASAPKVPAVAAAKAEEAEEKNIVSGIDYNLCRFPKAKADISNGSQDTGDLAQRTLMPCTCSHNKEENGLVPAPEALPPGRGFEPCCHVSRSRFRFKCIKAWIAHVPTNMID